jgi:hypothetical protein
MQIHKNPLLLRVLPGALEGGIDVLLTAVETKWQPDPRINNLGVSDPRIEIAEQAGIWYDPQQAFTQHCKAAQGSDGIGVEVN